LIYIFLFLFIFTFTNIFCHFKQKTDAQAILLNLFTVCSSCKPKFVVRPFVDEETFANGQNGFAHQCKIPILYDKYLYVPLWPFRLPKIINFLPRERNTLEVLACWTIFGNHISNCVTFFFKFSFVLSSPIFSFFCYNPHWIASPFRCPIGHWYRVIWTISPPLTLEENLTGPNPIWSSKPKKKQSIFVPYLASHPSNLTRVGLISPDRVGTT
jgi:hypothetical protein